MARKVHLDTSYIFVPGSFITIDKAIPQEKILLITNLNSNTVIFNFSDPNLKLNSYSRNRDASIIVTGTPGTNTVTNLVPAITPVQGERITGYGIPDNTYISSVSGTTLTLTTNTGAAANLTADPAQFGQPCSIFGTVIATNYNTASMNRTDKLQIFVDEYEETVRPAEVFNDPVSKQRVSTPQAMIDTDFEVGLQPTKWETLQKVSNRTSFFYNPTTPIPLNAVTPSAGTRAISLDTRTLGTGTISVAAGNTALTGVGTTFTSQLKVGTVIFDTNGLLIGAVASVTSDTAAVLKTGGAANAASGIGFYYVGLRFQDNGSPGSGIFSPTGTLTQGQSGVTTLTGTSTKFTTEVRPGDYIFQNNATAANQFVGVVASIQSDTSLTLTASSSNATGGTTANNYFYVSQYTPSISVGANTYGNPIYIQLTALPDANGSWLIDGVGASQTAASATTSLNTAASQVFYSMEATSPSIAINAATANGYLATVTFSTTQPSAPFLPGQLIAVTGTTVTGQTYNIASATVISCTTTTLTYNLGAVGGTYTSGGSVSFASIYDNPSTYAYPGQFFYQQQVGGTPLALTALAASGTGSIATLTFPTQAQPPFVPGQSITVSGATPAGYNATATVLTCTTSQVTYVNTTTGNITVAGTITGATQTFYTDGGNISGFSRITVVFDDPHALYPGSPIFVVGQQANITGSWYVASVPNSNTITYIVGATVSSITSATAGKVFVRTVGNVIHRPTDGGIRINCGINAPGTQLIRQSRRYFRYQSGKGIQYSTGTILRPTLNVNRLVSDGTLVTVYCKDAHYLYPGATVAVSGATQTGFNGTFVVQASGLSPKTFTYQPSLSGGTAPSASTESSGFPLNVAVTLWSGAQNRLGLFDGTNGMYFKYDGSTLYTVRRNSTELLAGNVQVTSGSSLVTGDTDTRFAAQLKPGHYVQIRGQIYLVTSVYSNNAITISPEYRGTSITSGSYAKISRIQELEIPQTQWNIDKCDGNGPSGYTLDLSKIQMFYIDYSWYGAGAIRYGFKDQRGEVIYVNRITHANNRTEAYLRSGNIGARYETNTIQPNTNLATGGVAYSVTTGGTIPVTDVSQWPATGGVLVMPPPTGAGSSLATTAATSAGGIATISFAAQTYNTIPVGSVITVAGVTPSGFNGTYVVTASTTSSVSYTNATAGPQTVAGTVYTQHAPFEYLTYTAKNTTASPHTLTIGNRALAGSASITGATTIGSNTITGVTSASTIITPFMHIHSSQFPLGTYVVGVSGTTVYASNFASATNASATLYFTAPGASNAQTYSFSATQPIQTMYFNPMHAPTISHWGSSVIMDGRYDDDKSLIFTAGMKSSTSVSNSAGSNVVPLISIRVGPSVDTGIADVLGRKEIINRMQLVLNSLDVSYTGQFLIDLRLNGQLSGGTWQSLGGSSLAQVCYHSGHTISGGESTYTFLTSNAAGVQTYSLDKARDLGNSIVGGGYTSNVKDTFYPDGPDIITIVATNIDSAAKSILARISWSEAQA